MVENPNLRSHSSLEVNVIHWRSLRLSNDLQNRRQNTSSYTYGVSFPRFFGMENPNLRSASSLEVNTSSYTYGVSFPRIFGMEKPNLRSD